MTAKDAPHDGAEFDFNKITSLSADGCARPGGRSNYTPPASSKAPNDKALDASGFDGFDDEVGDGANQPQKFVDSGFDGYDDDRPAA